VVALFVDPAGAADRGPDRLRTSVIVAGDTVLLAPPADLPETSRCLGDVTAVFGDGRELRLNGVDLCGAQELVLQ
jgi:hypothetical protein